MFYKNMNDQEYLNNLRHSCAHLLAKSVLELWPGTHNAIGPSIENGFYQDFDFGDVKISDSDLSKIEQKMKEILPTWTHFEFKEVTLDEAKKLFKHNPYKIELAIEFAGEDKKLMTNDPGNFLDLCKMGHPENPSQEIKHFKLLKIAGAYWRGNEKNKMLTRIYGTCFPTKEELELYLWQQEEAKKRDHRKIGTELDLFHFQPEAPGIPFWHPKGMIIRNELLQFSRDLQKRYGYKEIQTPIMLDVNVFKQSGHWDHYRNDMFFTDYEEKRQLALKPMNCPGMIQVYKASQKSYRDLPLYLSEYGLITRKEKSGELNGMFRVMQATQDDAHLFVTKDGIGETLEKLIALVEDIYKVFGVKYKAYLSTRPDDFMGEIETWNKAEDTLKKAMEKAGLAILLKERDGAFYGPKIDYQLEDSLGRTWQCATLQLDFQMPETFNLEYTDNDGKTQRPVMVHRTIIGSVERFVGILTEHYGGAFPAWLSPVQVKVIPVSDKVIDYARAVYQQLQDVVLRTELDDRNEKLGAKIRDAQMQKIPYMIIVGQKEVEGEKIAVRLRDGRDLGQMNISEFIVKVGDRVLTKSLNLW